MKISYINQKLTVLNWNNAQIKSKANKKNL